jgi:hypothetical protein
MAKETKEEYLKRIKEEALHPKEPDENCDHIWKQTGYWDGTRMNAKGPLKDNWVGGPTGRCIKCQGVKHFYHEEWNALLKEKKIELSPRKDDD